MMNFELFSLVHLIRVTAIFQSIQRDVVHSPSEALKMKVM
jgi:hypothetical protein